MDPVLRQKLLDTYRRDMENYDNELSNQRDRQYSEMEAKIAARRARKLADAKRQEEEELAQRLLDAQSQQMERRVGGASSAGEHDDLLRMPQVQYGESIEEQALKKEQVNFTSWFLGFHFWFIVCFSPMPS